MRAAPPLVPSESFTIERQFGEIVGADASIASLESTERDDTVLVPEARSSLHHFRSWLDRRFHITERGSTMGVEIRAGGDR